MKLGLSEEDKAKHPYYLDKQIKEEAERWKEATTSPEYIQSSEKFRRALEDHLHLRLIALFKARNIKEPTVGIAVRDTSFLTKKICEDVAKSIPYLTEKMLERFDLVKEKEEV